MTDFNIKKFIIKFQDWLIVKGFTELASPTATSSVVPGFENPYLQTLIDAPTSLTPSGTNTMSDPYQLSYSYTTTVHPNDLAYKSAVTPNDLAYKPAVPLNYLAYNWILNKDPVDIKRIFQVICTSVMSPPYISIFISKTNAMPQEIKFITTDADNQNLPSFNQSTDADNQNLLSFNQLKQLFCSEYDSCNPAFDEMIK